MDLHRRPEGAYSLKTSTELLKVLNRIWSLEEQHTANVSLVKALKVELQNARARIQELMQEQQSYSQEVDSLMKQLSENKVIQKNKEREKIKSAVESMRDELEDERRLRKRSESLHRKLGRELSEIKSAFLKAVKDLEMERKANQLLGNLCDEFAKGIRNYEDEVRDLKQKTGKDYEYKFDRLILHISEAWLDERMQMQMAESRGDLVERDNSITERLSGEIQAFLQMKCSANSKEYDANLIDRKREINLRRQSLESVHLNGPTSAPQDGEDDDSIASDLHCFELNMGEHEIKSHEQLKGTYGNGVERLDSARKSYFRGKKIEFPENITDQSASSSQMLIGQKEKKESGNRVQNTTSEHGAQIGVRTLKNEINMDRKFEENQCQEGDASITPEQNNVHGASRLSESFDFVEWKARFGEGTSSEDLHNHHPPSSNLEISESSSKLSQGVRENTLKAKLLEARLEGRHARLKALRGSSITRTKQQTKP